jgi:RNA polymerase sigma factor (sigma-70 family)
MKTQMNRRERTTREDRHKLPSAEEAGREFGDTSGELHYVHHPSFSLPATAERLWGEEREVIDVPPYSLMSELEPDHKAPASGRPSLSREQEKTLFLRYNYAKYRLKKLLEQRATPKRKQAAARWRDRARAMREKIIHANLPLVPAMAKRKRVDGVDFADKVSEGYLAILRSVEYFDVSRGFKFSTYACRAILAALYRIGSKAQTYRKYIPVYFEPALERDDFVEQRHERDRTDAIESMRRVLQSNAAGLSEVEEEIIRQRFPLGGHGKVQPLWTLGRELGVSTERVRQIEKASLVKLGDAMEKVLAV